MFFAEEEGLQMLASASACRVPEVIGVFEGESASGILLEWIDSGPASDDAWASFGRDLAHLHEVTSVQFGLDHTNYMGSLQQINNFHVSFPDFFREERLKPQIELAVNRGFLEAGDISSFDRIFKWLDENMADEKPSLVHGDLWSGNAMIDTNGRGVLIDPAVSFSSSHVDMAMTTLFGGFNDYFYAAYAEVRPFNLDHQRVWDIMNLYPLLVHVNLFGSSYLSQTRQILRSI
jgi:fructosamine-3-kinase